MAEHFQSLMIKFVKFGLVGFSGLIIDFGVTYIIKEKLRWNKYIANSLGFILASGTNYYLNRIWTFQSTDPAIALQYSKFVMIAVLGLLLNNLVIYLLTDKLFNLNFYIAKFLAIVAVFIWNFLLNYTFTFTS